MFIPERDYSRLSAAMLIAAEQWLACAETMAKAGQYRTRDHFVELADWATKLREEVE